MTTYADLDAKLTGRCSQSRKIANNTYAERCGDDIAIRLHATDVVTFHRDGTRTLNTGGWYTVTTKARINDYLPGGVFLSSVKGRWFLGFYGQDVNHRVPFADGMRLDQYGDVVSGEPCGPDVMAEDSANEAMRKAVQRYLKRTKPEDIVKAFTHPAGDCILCRWEGRETEAEHLALHVEEQYVMYSLALNAVKARGFLHPDVIMSMIYNSAQRGEVDRLYTDSMRKYLRKHLTVGAVAVA